MRASSTSAPTKKTFKLTARAVLLTYKDIGDTKEDILARCNKTPFIFGAVVAKELYRNGTAHFHVYIETLKPVEWTMQQLDAIGGVHGNYKPLNQTPKRALAYVIKNGDFVATEDPTFSNDYVQSALATYAYRTAEEIITAAFLDPQTKLKPKNFQVNVKTGPPNKK